MSEGRKKGKQWEGGRKISKWEKRKQVNERKEKQVNEKKENK